MSISLPVPASRWFKLRTILLISIASAVIPADFRDALSEVHHQTGLEAWAEFVWGLLDSLVDVALCAITVFLLIKASERAKVRRLITLTALWAFANARNGLEIVAFRVWKSETVNDGIEVLHSFILALLVVTLLRFAQTFPRPLRADEIMFRLQVAPTSERLRVLPPRFARRHNGMRYLSGVRRFIDPLVNCFLRFARGLMDSRWMAVFASIMVALPSLLLLFSPDTAFVVRDGLLTTAIMVTFCYFAISYRSAGGAARRKVLWILASASAMLPAVLLVIWETIETYVGIPLIAPSLVGVLFELLTALAVTCLVVGVFFEGVPDPRLVVRRAVTLGLLTIPFTVVMTVAETIGSEVIQKRLHLPEGLFGAVVATLVFGFAAEPLSRIADRIIEGLAGRLDDDPGDAPGRPVLLLARYASPPTAAPPHGFTWLSFLREAAAQIAEGRGGGLVTSAATDPVAEYPNIEAAISGAEDLRRELDGSVALHLPATPLRIGIIAKTAGAGAVENLDLIEAAKLLTELSEPGELAVTEIIATELAQSALLKRCEYAGEISLSGVPGTSSISCFRCTCSPHTEEKV